MMKEGLPPIDTPTGYAHLLGTRWRNKRSGNEYIITQKRGNGDAYLNPFTKDDTSRWVYSPHLTFDYEEIKDAGQTATP